MSGLCFCMLFIQITVLHSISHACVYSVWSLLNNTGVKFCPAYFIFLYKLWELWKDYEKRALKTERQRERDRVKEKEVLKSIAL